MLYNVLDASRLLGIRKVVAASSECALGYIFAKRPIPVKYYPIDEEHPIDPQDGYGGSKAVGEDLCRSFASAYGMQAVSLRFGRVVFAESDYEEIISTSQADPEVFKRFFWSYVDVRDVATACRLALETDGLGAEVFNIIAADSQQETPTNELMAEHYPEAEDRTNRREGTFSPHDSSKAGRLMGWEPRHSWRMYV